MGVAPGLSYRAEFGGGLDAWAEVGAEVSVTEIDAEWERVVVEDALGIGEAERRFARVAVEYLAQ
jgi:hypothetical protein